MLTAVLWMFLTLPAPQNVPSTGSAPNNTSTTDDVPLPYDAVGVLIRGADWTSISQSVPSRSKTKRGLAAAFSYGIISASIATEFPGRHAPVQVSEPRPWICICNLDSSAGEILLVRLRTKKDSRELNGGRLPVFGAKVGQAEESDTIAMDEFDQEDGVRLFRPRTALPEGEYALALGRQNVAIFAFGVSAPRSRKQTVSPHK